MTALLSKLMVMLSLAWPAPPADIAELDPVLLVHGYFLGEATWWSLKGRLVDAGWPEDFVHILEFDDVVGCNPGHAMEIEAKVEEVLAATGRDKLDLVSHSMGANDTRYWIKNMCGYQRVVDWVSLGGASHGTIVGCVDFLSCGAEDMCIPLGGDGWQENDFLVALNDCDETPGDILYTSIWTEFDEIITPSAGSKLDGARNIEVDALVGHGLILTSKEAADYVMEALLGAGKNDNVPIGEGPCVQLCGADIPPDPSEVEGEPDPELEPEPAPEPEPELAPEPEESAEVVEASPEPLLEILGEADGAVGEVSDVVSPDLAPEETALGEGKHPASSDGATGVGVEATDLPSAEAGDAAEASEGGSTSSSGCGIVAFALTGSGPRSSAVAFLMLLLIVSRLKRPSAGSPY